MAARRRAFMGPSEVGLGCSGASLSRWPGVGSAEFDGGVPRRPRTLRTPGSHFLFAAATVMRLAMKEFPSSEPATTMHTSAAATFPNAGPRSRVIDVCGWETS